MVFSPFDADTLAARINAAFREFFKSEAVGGIPLFAAAVLALWVANSPLAPVYFSLLHHPLGPMSVQHWVNDGLMALFFLMVGLEMKRELMEGQLSGWPARVLPGAAALGGMIVPALIYLAFAGRSAPDGWAISSATDIAFALGVLALVGTRLPPALRIFLTALAIIDDLGAVVIIALFYSHGLSLPALAGAGVVTLALVGMNVRGVRSLSPYVLLGAVLWFLVLRSGIHATLAGVVLALTIPLNADKDDPHPPLHRLEHRLNFPVALAVVPLFGFANAGVSFAGVGPALFAAPVFWGVAAGLLVGKLAGVLGAVLLMVRTGLAELPEGVRWPHMFGVALLCGIGFTMSLFIGLLAFDDPLIQDKIKIAILAASVIAGLSGFCVLGVTRRTRGNTVP